MALKHYLAWTVMLAALTRATTKCNFCKKEISYTADKLVDFLTPCCDELEYPFTFLAHFTADQHNITFHLHEYYLPDTQVRLCFSTFYEMYDDYYYVADDYSIERYCVDDYPFRCLSEKSLSETELRFRSWSEDGFLNITVPFKPRPLLQTHKPYAGRPIFNITYEWRRLSEPSAMADPDRPANLDMCSFNGYPVLTYDATRKSYVYDCRCFEGANGSQCQWGGGCHSRDPFSLCSGHGKCRYYRGSIKCICDEEHFGHKCEHPISSGQPLPPSTCAAMGLECSHLCSLAGRPHCLCPPYLELHNDTLCTPRAQLVDVTVQLMDSHHHHFPADQARKLLKESCTTVVNGTYHQDSKEFHFAMNKYHKNCFPERSRWEAELNSSVSLSLADRDFLWVGPLNKSVEEGGLVLQCTVYASLLPFNVSFFIGQHQIYSREVNKCKEFIEDEAMSIGFEKDEDVTHDNDTTCSRDDVCVNNTVCAITLKANGYDPDLDWGEFSAEVSHGINNLTRQSVVVDPDPRLLVVVEPLSASVDKNGSTNLTCILLGDWKWNEDCEIKWVFPMDSGVFEVATPRWNVSYLYINHLQESITVTCEVAVWRFCDDRMSRTRDVCAFQGCKPQVVAVHCLQESPHCPAQTDASVVWHTTPVNAVSYSNCPEGFEGSSTRQCELGQNETAVWAEPDYYYCVYRPFNDLLQRPVMRYLKRGYRVGVDPNTIVEEMRQLFEERKRMLLPREHSFIQDQLKYLLRPSGPPIDPTVFLGFFQEIRKKMAVNDTWQLQPLVRTYLGMETSQRECWKQGDLQLCVKDIPASLSVEYPEGELTKRLHLELTMAQRDREAAYVAVLMFLDPKIIPAGVVYSTDVSEEETLGPVLSCPAVEVAAISNDLSIRESITFNMSYYDADVTMDRNVCGGAKVSGAAGAAVAWDLSRCVTLSREPRDGGPTRCQCRGQGLFAFIRLPELVPTDTDC